MIRPERTKHRKRDARLSRSLIVGVSALALAVAACKGGGGGGGAAGGGPGQTIARTNGASTSTLSGTTGPFAPFNSVAQQSLTVADVQLIISRAVAEANARGALATIAVVDRVGNVLAVFRMTGAATSVTIQSGRGNNTGLQGLAIIPDSLAAIAKAVTGAYLSSSGNAFSTRTASYIVQQAFPPGAVGAGFESGPLFGVQFSQLPCSDLSARFLPGGGPAALIGPKRSPLGLAADPGGFPLYKNGAPVGGVGVIADGIYGLDLEAIRDVDTDLDELIATAAIDGFGPPADIRAERIPVDGTNLGFTDRGIESLLSNPLTPPAFATVNGPLGALVTVNGYKGVAAITAGVPFGTEASGIRPSTLAEFPENPRIHVLTDGSGNNRFPPRAGTDTPAGNAANTLTAAEVRQLLLGAFSVAQDGRAQIRRPLNSRIQVTISVVDTNGQVLGLARTPDGPMFGTDVSLQKARTAAFFSNAVAGAELDAAGAAIGTAAPGFAGLVAPLGAILGPLVTEAGTYIAGRSAAARAFLGDPAALTGTVAFADRSGGNLSRPFFPDGDFNDVAGGGPFSRPFADWSPFSTGLQESIVRANIFEHIGFVVGAVPNDTPPACGTLNPGNGFAGDLLPSVGVPAQPRLSNGFQIFPGSVPIYRGGVLVGGIGVSGDGIDQDDMISFLGLDRASQALGLAISNAPTGIRADTLSPIAFNGRPVRLRYVNCPFNPFVGSNEQNVCIGK